MAEEKKGGCGGLFWLVILVVGGYFVFTTVLSPPPTEVQQKQLDPESAVKHYLSVAHKFSKDPFQKGGKSGDLRECVTEEDWDWFENNYKKLDYDAFDLASGINPSDADTVARLKVLTQLVTLGPDREDATIKSVKVDGDKATIVVNQYVGGGKENPYFSDYTVELVKKGKYWKVKDFGGGRTRIR